MAEPAAAPEGAEHEAPQGGNEGTPDIQKQIAEAVARETASLKNNRDEILQEKRETEKRLKTLEETWKGLDPETVKPLLDRLANDEETKLIAEGKVDEVISRRTDALRGDFETKLKASQDANAELEAKLETSNKQIAQLVIDGQVREAAAKAGLQPTAIADVVARAHSVFKLGDDLSPIARDEHGTLLMGKDGKNPLSVEEWLDTMKDKAPHWWPGSSGAGAGGGAGGKGSAFTLTKTQAQDTALYRRTREAAAKVGQQVTIIEG